MLIEVKRRQYLSVKADGISNVCRLIYFSVYLTDSMVSPSLGILLGPVTLLWAILAATTSMDPGTQTLFTMALTGGFGTVMYTVVGAAVAGLAR